MAAKSIRYIEQQLRCGKTPEQLGGKVIGRGAVKAAYYFESPNGGFIVKENAQGGLAGTAQKTPPKGIKKFGARAPRTYKVGEYLIQERVTVLATIKDWQKLPVYKQWKALHHSGVCVDAHEYNCGVDSNGQLVVFDW